MPVRSLPGRSSESSVLKWPGRAATWGVGSDLDIVAIVDATDEPFERRSFEWDLNALPVPTEMLVYTVDEWKTLQSRGKGFVRALMVDTVWVYVKSREPIV